MIYTDTSHTQGEQANTGSLNHIFIYLNTLMGKKNNNLKLLQREIHRINRFHNQSMHKDSTCILVPLRRNFNIQLNTIKCTSCHCLLLVNHSYIVPPNICYACSLSICVSLVTVVSSFCISLYLNNYSTFNGSFFNFHFTYQDD